MVVDQSELGDRRDLGESCSDAWIFMIIGEKSPRPSRWTPKKYVVSVAHDEVAVSKVNYHFLMLLIFFSPKAIS